MIEVRMSDMGERTFLRALANAYPKEARRALARYGGLLRRRMAKETKGAAGVPMSEIRDIIHPGKSGGILGNARTIKMAKPSRYAIIVDWIEPLRGFASMWQGGGDVGMARKEVRHYLHAALGARGRRDVEVDPAATQPQRPVTGPIADDARREAPRVILGMLKTLIAKGNRRWTPRLTR